MYLTKDFLYTSYKICVFPNTAATELNGMYTPDHKNEGKYHLEAALNCRHLVPGFEGREAAVERAHC